MIQLRRLSAYLSRRVCPSQLQDMLLWSHTILQVSVLGTGYYRVFFLSRGSSDLSVFSCYSHGMRISFALNLRLEITLKGTIMKELSRLSTYFSHRVCLAGLQDAYQWPHTRCVGGVSGAGTIESLSPIQIAVI